MDFDEKDAHRHSSDEHDPAPLPLVRLNHVSFQCESVEASVDFYQRVLGFELVKRPASLDFRGAWWATISQNIPLACLASACYLFIEIFTQGEVNSLVFRLHKYGMGIHLLQRGSDSKAPAAARPPAINPKGNHISFQVTARALAQN
jgi:catechol 2,3-dioxygenase-like lactoylglutathione lyase family enzyme